MVGKPRKAVDPRYGGKGRPPRTPKITADDLASLRLAFDAASRSQDPSTRVGVALPVQMSRGPVTITECNDLPPNTPLGVWDDREEKYKAVVHAEMAALLRAGHLARGATLYSSMAPCMECAKHIAFAGIRRVVAVLPPPSKERWRDEALRAASYMRNWWRIQVDLIDEDWSHERESNVGHPATDPGQGGDGPGEGGE